MGKKNSAGKYRGRVQIGIDKDGKPISKYVCASTLWELEQKKAEVRHYYVEGQPRQEDRMKIVGHTDYQTTANIYTHLGNESLRRAAVDMRGVFDPKGKAGAGPR